MVRASPRAANSRPKIDTEAIKWGQQRGERFTGASGWGYTAFETGFEICLNILLRDLLDTGLREVETTLQLLRWKRNLSSACYFCLPVKISKRALNKTQLLHVRSKMTLDIQGLFSETFIREIPFANRVKIMLLHANIDLH